MKNWFHSPVDAKKLSCAGFAALMPFAFLSLFASAQSTTTPPVVIPYTMSTVAGNGSSGATGNGGPALSAALSADMRAVAVDGQGNIYIVDTTNSVVRKVNGQTGVITLVAGGQTTACTTGIDKSGDGCPAATGTKLVSPRGVAVDKAGNVYIAGYSDELIHRVDAVTGLMTLVAGQLTGSSTTCTHAYSCAAGTKGYSPDGTAAVGAALNQPRGVRVDNAGNVWIADTGNNVIREISATTGNITTVVGNTANTVSGVGAAGFGGDGGQANSASVLLTTPTDIVFDSQNNAYIVDFGNHRIRKVDASTNVISTIIGNSNATAPTTAPSWPASATNTGLGGLTKVAIDSYGNLYFADSGLSLIFFYDAAAGTITPIAGEYDYAGTASSSFPVCADATNTLGDGCPATQALFYQGASSALGVALDGQNNIYITDPADYRIRKVSTNLSFPASATGTPVTQTIEVHSTTNDTLASNGIAIGTNLGGFTVASAPTCTSNSDNTTNCLVQVSFTPGYPGLQAAPLVATSTLTSRSLPLTGVGQAALSGLDPGTASTLGTGLTASVGEAVDANGNLYIADTGNNSIVKISASTQLQTIIAGTGAGNASQATLNAPKAVAVGPNGFIYIADTGNNLVRLVNPGTGNITTYAGGATTVCASAYDAQGDFCPATQAKLSAPSGLAVDNLNNLYIADTGNNTVRRVDSGTGYINLDAGLATPLSTTATASTVCSGETDSYGDGCSPTQAILSAPHGLATNSLGSLFVADTGHNLVREIGPGTGTITTVAGNGQAVFSGDNGAATSASLNAPQAIAVDGAGNLYIADTGNDAIRMVTNASGLITTLFGQGGTAGSTGGSDGVLSELLLSSPSGIAIDASGNLYVSDTVNNRVIEDNRNVANITFGVVDVGGTATGPTLTVTDLGNESLIFNDSPAYLLTGTGSASFSVDTSASTACAGAGTLTAGENCTLEIKFTPTATSPYLASLTFPSNAVNPAAEVAISGTGKVLIKTGISLTQSPAGQIYYGQSGTITATVTPTSGTGIPSGTVSFYEYTTSSCTEQTLLGTPTLSSSGTAQLTLNLPPVGNINICAIYNTDGTYASSTNSTTVVIAQDITTTTLAASTTTQTSAQPNITFTATVTSNTGTLPNGIVYFCTGTVTSCTSTSSTRIGSGVTLSSLGQASVTYTSTSGTGYSVTATYAGNTNFGSSTSVATAIAIPADFSATVSPASASVPQGGAVQISGLSVATQGNISGAVSLSCIGLPANSTCTFFPTTLTVGGTSPVLTTSLTITTNVIPLALQSQLENTKPSKRAPVLLGVALIPSMLFAFGGLVGFRRRDWFKTLMVLAAAAIFSSTLLTTGCGNNATQQKAGVTPTGTSTVQIVFTGPNSVTHSVPITLTVIAQ